MPINTINTTLSYKQGTGSTYTKLIDIKDYSDLFGAKEQLDVTTLSDTVYKYIDGIQANDPITFTCNYTKTDLTTIQALAGTEQEFKLDFGQSGADGSFTFKGYISVTVNGKGVNEVREMTLTIVVSTSIEVA